MAARRATFRQADLKRALSAARAAGLAPQTCRIVPATGEIELQFRNDNAGPTDEAGAAFDAWKARRDARSA